MSAAALAAPAVGARRAETTSVCIVSHFALGALQRDGRGRVGGVEWQTSLLASWLADRGHTVTLLAWDEGQPDGLRVNGVQVVKLCAPDAGLRGLRFFHPRWTSLVRGLRSADARIYYQNGAEYVTGQVAWWARRHGRAFVFSVASDPDCDPALPALPTARERVLYRYGVSSADEVVVQTHAQRSMLEKGFGRTAKVIPMPCPGPREEGFEAPPPPVPGRARVLWMGRISPEKRPDRLLEVARRCPELEFDLVGPIGDARYAEEVLASARGMVNVAVHGPVTRERVPEWYRRAAALLCTSDIEGFPNTFLEAWSHGVPVVSTIDPDGLLRQRGLGEAVADVATLAAALRRVVASPDHWCRISARARDYYLAHHTLDATMPRMEGVLVEAARARRRGRA